MEVISEANLEYESEIKRNPGIPRIWLNYLADSKQSSHEVCLFHFTIPVFLNLVPHVALLKSSGRVSTVLQDLGGTSEGPGRVILRFGFRIRRISLRICVSPL